MISPRKLFSSCAIFLDRNNFRIIFRCLLIDLFYQLDKFLENSKFLLPNCLVIAAAIIMIFITRFRSCARALNLDYIFWKFGKLFFGDSHPF